MNLETDVEALQLLDGDELAMLPPECLRTCWGTCGATLWQADE